MLKVLIVEDEKPIRILTRAKLKNSYQVFEAANGLEALEVMEHTHIDIIISDIMMPDMDGYELVESIRSAGDMIPVIFLTAMNTFAHKKKAFQTGIDDYMTKPIDYEELEWRMDALIRRARIANEKKIEAGNFSLSVETHEAVWDDKRVQFTEKEFELLYKLLSYPNVIFTKQQIMDEVWGYDTESDYNTIKTFISRIRNKLAGCKEVELVSVRGLGYKAVLKEEQE